MNHLTGSCPVCEKKFKPEDDVVICPDCGAPYHRDCYNKVGHCLFEDKHGAGFEYKDPAGEKAPVAGETNPDKPVYPMPEQGTGGGILCPRCQTVNDKQNIFCERCGAPLHSQPSPQNPGPMGGMGNRWPGGGMGGNGFDPAGAGGGLFGRTWGGAEVGDIDGFTPQEWTAYIGASAPSYLNRMAIQDMRGTKFSFTLSAFIFGAFYFAYRKMWGWAAIAFATFLLLQAPATLFMLADAGVPFMAGFSIDVLRNLAVVANYLSLFRSMFFGIMALQLYRKQAVKHMGEIKAKSPQNTYYLYMQKGGVNIAVVVLMLLILFAISSTIMYYSGDALFKYIEQMYPILQNMQPK